MSKVTRDTVIARAPADVFRALVDPRERAAWMRAFDETPLPAGATLAVGTRIAATRRGSTSGSRYELTVTQWEDARRLTMSVARNGARVATSTFELTPEGSATRVRATSELHLSGLQRMMAPALALATEKQMGEELAALKRHVESSK